MRISEKHSRHTGMFHVVELCIFNSDYSSVSLMRLYSSNLNLACSRSAMEREPSAQRLIQVLDLCASGRTSLQRAKNSALTAAQRTIYLKPPQLGTLGPRADCAAHDKGLSRSLVTPTSWTARVE